MAARSSSSSSNSSNSSSTSNTSKNALTRIVRDLKELQTKPVPGVSACPVAENIFKLHVNIVVPEGPYSGLIIHMVLDIPSTYPHSSPAGSIAPNFPFTHNEHEHIYGIGICNDYLSNFENFFKGMDGGEIKAGSGWSPGVTLKGLLMVMKTFFVETDLSPPSTTKVASIFQQANSYKCDICGHTTKNPFPPLPTVTETDVVTLEKQTSATDLIVSRARNHLVCSISKENYIDNPNLILGYPINLNLDRRDRLWTTLFPEMISYEQFVTEIQRCGADKLDDYNRIRFKTASGQLYNNWLPVYINEAHFYQNLQCMKNTISVLSNGVYGTKANEFKPYMVLRVLPSLMNKMVVALMDNLLHESENAIFAYCHYLRLFMRFVQEYPEIAEMIDEDIANFISHNKYRNKKYVPDIGEFLVWIALSKKYSYYDENVQRFVIEEYLARQVFFYNRVDKLIHKEPSATKRLAKTFELTKVSNQLLVFNLMVSKHLIFEGVEQKLDNNFGLPPDKIVSEFQKLIKQIKSICNYAEFMKAISYSNVIVSPAKMLSLLDHAIQVSKHQGYTQFV
ncbi:MAG: ubiquitin-conjugating enzyme [Homavirus sp.]|uniref:E2 ubiquitin-conjugating enzyme n=1 Tax=Homavirus sp. TaxID=2487769 RepID=A0A3G5A507_9VIRU|nr:MAG: ubiquitin-conjugating enzyme [Homavirus sp.]